MTQQQWPYSKTTCKSFRIKTLTAMAQLIRIRKTSFQKTKPIFYTTLTQNILSAVVNGIRGTNFHYMYSSKHTFLCRTYMYYTASRKPSDFNQFSLIYSQLHNGSLYLLPFTQDQNSGSNFLGNHMSYHSSESRFRCRATNAYGKIVSKVITVKPGK